MQRIQPMCPICHQPMAIAYRKTTISKTVNSEEYWQWEEHSCDRCGYRTSADPEHFSDGVTQRTRVKLTWV